MLYRENGGRLKFYAGIGRNVRQIKKPRSRGLILIQIKMFIQNIRVQMAEFTVTPFFERA